MFEFASGVAKLKTDNLEQKRQPVPSALSAASCLSRRQGRTNKKRLQVAEVRQSRPRACTVQSVRSVVGSRSSTHISSDKTMRTEVLVVPEAILLRLCYGLFVWWVTPRKKRSLSPNYPATGQEHT